MKYIGADRLRALLETRYNAYKIGQHSPFRNGKTESLRETIDLIDSLQQEQQEEPDKSLEEAAEEYIKKGYLPVAFVVRPAFIAGAEWAIHYQEKKIDDAYEKGKQEGIRVVRSWESSPGQGGY